MMKRLDSIQMLRGIAASLVVLFHLKGIEQRYGDPTAQLLSWYQGEYGVDIFFVISGFIMIYITFNKPATPAYAKDFLLKRLLRIVPPYWFYTTVVVVLLVVLPQAFRDMHFSLVQVVKSYLFIPQKELPVLQVGWSLEYELYFYLVIAAFLLLGQKLLPSLSVFLGLSAVLGVLWKPEFKPLLVVTNLMLLEFLLGVYIGYFFVRGRYLSRPLAWVATIAGVFLFGYSFFDRLGEHRLFFWGIPSFLLVWGALSLEHQGISFNGALSKLGDSSYSLYLSHIFVLFFVGKVWAWIGFSGYSGNLALIVVGYSSCLLVGIISYRFVEQSSLNYLSAKLVKNKDISPQKGALGLNEGLTKIS